MIGILAWYQDLVSWKSQEINLVKVQSWVLHNYPL